MIMSRTITHTDRVKSIEAVGEPITRYRLHFYDGGSFLTNERLSMPRGIEDEWDLIDRKITYVVDFTNTVVRITEASDPLR
jgi:hypothetical protein